MAKSPGAKNQLGCDQNTKLVLRADASLVYETLAALFRLSPSPDLRIPRLPFRPFAILPDVDRTLHKLLKNLFSSGDRKKSPVFLGKYLPAAGKVQIGPLSNDC